jgi:hypothetical protein
MYTAINHRPKSKQPNQFLSARSGEFELEFKPGECACKACSSNNVRFVAYVEDAKCDECLQWQNEDLIPANH